MGEKGKFPWDDIIFIPCWLVSGYSSVAFPHKTFNLSFLEVPMTPPPTVFRMLSDTPII